MWNFELNNAKKSCFKPFDWTIWSHSQPRSEQWRHIFHQQLQNYCNNEQATSKLLYQTTRAKLFHHLETFPRVWQKPIECYVTCHSVHFYCGQIGLDAPNNMTILEKVINVSLERLFNCVQWPHLKCKHVGRWANNKFNCKAKWKPRRQHACNTLQAELDTWGYFCCQYTPTHKSPLLSLNIFTYSRGSLCKWVVSVEKVLQAIIILLYHYF